MGSNSIPKYSIRGHNIWGFRDMAHFLDYLYEGTQIKSGSVIAINAEKILTAETDTALNELLNEADYLYADGISVVRGIRRKYPDAHVSRIAGADLW
ncbi:lipopolysaccharide N-acetylmannosaminouronosyltransferase, partial [Klebsiella variicola subsp. variicola]